MLASSLTMVLPTLALGTVNALAAADHFILTQIASLMYGRMDPIVSPGEISGHVHNIMGASCIGTDDLTPQQQQDCSCSSVIVNDDKSNYWAPLLYYQYPNGTFTPLLNQNRIYYFTKGHNVTAFPPGLRMITGMSTERDAANTKTAGVRISCNHGLQTPYLPNGTSHPEGCQAIAAGVYFASCGMADGTLDSDDHWSHMAWPQSILGGGGDWFDDVNGQHCPDSHPIKYPTMFMEANYYLTPEQPWHDGNPLILSNGDQSGLTYHADFVAGWKAGVLEDAIKECGDGKGVGEDLPKCAPLAKSVNVDDARACRYQGKIPNEDVGLYRPIQHLPGCNTIWPTTGPKTKPACTEANPPAMLNPNAMFVNLQYREALPMMFTHAENLTDYWAIKAFIPGLGYNGASSVKQWGSDGVNKDDLRISTVNEILGAAGGNAFSAPPGHKSSPVASHTATRQGPSGLAGANVALVALENAPSTASEAAQPTDDTQKSCSRRATIDEGHVKEHVERRSRRAVLGH